MSKIRDFIKNDCQVYYLATVDGNQPKVRPLAFCEDVDGKVEFAVGDYKRVYKQLQANSLCEIVGFAPEYKKWIRYTGRAVFETDPEINELPFKEYPALRGFYEKLCAKPALFHLVDAKCEILGMTGNVIETLI